jgi:hypothetical protein
MTGRCHDFSGPAEPVIATSQGWVPLDEPHAAHLAVSGMLLACTPEHVERLHRGRAATPLPPTHSVGEQSGVSP